MNVIFLVRTLPNKRELSSLKVSLAKIPWK